MSDGRSARRGFALLTTLWLVSIASIAALAAAVAGRNAELAGASRVELERARWIALGCGRRAAASIDAALRDAPTDSDAKITWRTLSAQSELLPPMGPCDIGLEAAGTRLDVNAASDEMLRALLEGNDVTADITSLIDALDDWRDTDDTARPNGAERDWYERVGRIPPRNGRIADIRELFRVRGFETLGGIDSLLTTDAGRVSLATAPAAVLLAIPGITRETADAIVARRVAGEPLDDLIDIAGTISDASADSLAAHFTDAVRLTTPDPDAWLLTVRVVRGAPAVTATLVWRLVRVGRRCAVASTRSDA